MNAIPFPGKRVMNLTTGSAGVHTMPITYEIDGQRRAANFSATIRLFRGIRASLLFIIW
jgi:hypothetical protein